MTYNLALCIPNYNREKELKRLLLCLCNEIERINGNEKIQICVSDDGSEISPEPVVEEISKIFPGICIKLSLNKSNMGMDYNFLASVRMADAEYCWIIGNDDEIVEGAIEQLRPLLETDTAPDLIVTPFDVYDSEKNFRGTVRPLNTDKSELVFDTKERNKLNELLRIVKDGNGLFCFLSNIVFRRIRWLEHGDMFSDKMNTIFIQMYMNIQSLMEGAVYLYKDMQIIRQYTDDEINATIKREYDVLMGLNGVIDYFFSESEMYRSLQSKVVDPRINERMWNVTTESGNKRSIEKIKSPKINLYKEYYIERSKRKDFFNGKEIHIYGAGDIGHKVFEEVCEYCPSYVKVYDADESKIGKMIGNINIFSPYQLFSEYSDADNTCVIIANNKVTMEIYEIMKSHLIENIVIMS